MAKKQKADGAKAKVKAFLVLWGEGSQDVCVMTDGKAAVTLAKKKAAENRRSAHVFSRIFSADVKPAQVITRSWK